MNIYRHGDILLRPVGEIPSGETTKHRSLTIALSEATGHHHTLCSDASGFINTTELPSDSALHEPPIEYLELDDGRFLRINEAVELRHQEHHTLKIVPGLYEIINEREYDYFEESMKRVVD